MNAQQSERQVMHPTLPGEDLEYLWLEDGERICLYDNRYPDAYLIGKGVEVGVER